MPIQLTVGTDNPISVDPTQDLAAATQTILTAGPEFAGHLDQQISSLPTNLNSTSVQYTSGNGSWNLGSFGFTLSGSAKGSVSVITAANIPTFTDAFATDMSMGLNTTVNPCPTKPLPLDPVATYICIELCFQVTGGITGSFTSGIYGVTGSLSSSDSFTYAFYKKCMPTDSLRAGISAAFSDFVLPLQSTTLNKLKVGDFLLYNFNANLQLGLGASIGIDKVLYAGQYAADIPNAANAAAIVKVAAKPEIQAGAKLAFCFDYAGTFESLLWKTDANTGHLHLYRADHQDISLGLNLGVTLNSGLSANSSTTIATQLGALLAGSLPGGTLSQAGVNALVANSSSEINKYVNDANNTVAGWLKPFRQAQATLDFAIERTQQKFLLLDYTFDLTARDFQNAWNAANNGKFMDALGDPNGGVTLAPGSGLENFYDDKTSINLNLFGQLTASWTDALISNSSLFYAGNNIFHLISNVGRQLTSLVNKSDREIDLYFAAEAVVTAGTLTLKEPDLHCILQATDDQTFGNYIAAIITLLAQGLDNTAHTVATVKSLASQKNTTQVLHIVIPPAAYGNLKSSTITNDKPDNQAPDQANYAAFAQACSDLKFDQPASFSYTNTPLDYTIWSNWNIACTDQWPPSDGALPDRRGAENAAGVSSYLDPVAFPHAGIVTNNGIGDVLQAASDFMNFCEDLKTLGTLAQVQPNLQSWRAFVLELLSMIANDVSPYFIAPTALALTRQCGGGPPTEVVGPAPGLNDQNSIAITMTYS